MGFPADSRVNLPAYLQARDGAVWLSVKAQPRSRQNAIAGILGNELRIRVTAPPVDSAANEALVDFIAAILQCPRRSVTLARGASATHKLFRIEGLPPERVAAVLMPLSASADTSAR